MNKINNGGPAFPSLHELGDIATTDAGMTLRDYFAATVDMDVTINQQELAEQIVCRPFPEDQLEMLVFGLELSARVRYMSADAMLKAREM
jgi:hypothetical protein